MTPKARLLAALAGEQPDVQPVAPLYLSLYLAPIRHAARARRWRAKALAAGGCLAVTYEDYLDTEREVWWDGYRAFESLPDWLNAPGVQGPASIEGSAVEVDEQGCFWVDCGGARDRLDVPFSDQLAPLWEVGDPPTSVAEVRARMPITSAEVLRASGLHALSERLLAETGKTHALYWSCGAPYPAVYNLLGFSGLMFAMRERPELVTAAAEQSLAATVAQAEAARAAGLEVMFVEEWACSADLISPQDYAQFAWPFERDLCRELSRLGFATVFYFCGSIEDRLDKLAQLEASALAFEESKKGFHIDVRAIRKALGPERCLFGNLDVTLVRDLAAGPLLRVVDDLIRAGGPQAFVTSVGSPLTLDTPPARVDLLMEAARSHG